MGNAEVAKMLPRLNVHRIQLVRPQIIIIIVVIHSIVTLWVLPGKGSTTVTHYYVSAMQQPKKTEYLQTTGAPTSLLIQFSHGIMPAPTSDLAERISMFIPPAGWKSRHKAKGSPATAYVDSNLAKQALHCKQPNHPYLYPLLDRREAGDRSPSQPDDHRSVPQTMGQQLCFGGKPASDHHRLDLT